ncbi:MAG: ATP-binding protein, partial [Casimicrobiaceae bacterium]
SLVYPQVLAALRRGHDARWPDPALQSVENRSRELRRAVLGPVDAQARRYALVLAGDPTSFALWIDVKRLVPWDEWPLTRTGPVRVTLGYEGAVMVLQPGLAAAAQPAGLTQGFMFAKQLSAASQPFELRLSQATGPAEWPWGRLTAWTVFSGLATAAMAAWLRGRRERRRAEELLRVGQVARLNTMGELAGGIAHELNQPLAAVLASAQGAQRLLDDDPPALDTARQAMQRAAAQARRAADVVARLRRLVEKPNVARLRHPLSLEIALRDALDLFEPELRRLRIEVIVQGATPLVLADPVALEQIVHNLLGNAVQAMANVSIGHGRLTLHLHLEDGQGVLVVRDSGPGIEPEALVHVFEPFYTTRSGGLGLGLSLSETLTHAMEGTLTVRNATPRGTEFRLALPLAGKTA